MKKNQNPLYVVKGDQVESANDLIDLLIKKFNLEPLLDFFKMVFKIMLENIKTYPMLAAVVEFFELFFQRFELFKKYSIV